MIPIMDGAIALGFAAAGLFFLRFWRESRDRLFLFFALAFVVMAVNRVGLALAAQQGEQHDVLYWIRLLAYVLILIAIVDKNRAQKREGRERGGAA